MDGRTDGRTYGRTDGRMDVMDGRHGRTSRTDITDGRADARTNGRTYARMDGHTLNTLHYIILSYVTLYYNALHCITHGSPAAKK